MTKLVRYDNSCQLLNEYSEEVKDALNYQLSYVIQGAQHSKYATEGTINSRGELIKWDGRKQLLQGNMRFPIGLLDKVVEFYEMRGIDLDIIDRRKLISNSSPIDIMPVLKSQGKIPRNYQVDAVEKAAEVNRGIIRIATGGGKCSCKDSLIVTEHGLLTYEELLGDIKLSDQELCDSEIEVGTSKKFGGVEKTSMIYHDGYGVSRRVITSYGFENTATPEHKIQVMSEHGDVEWKKYKNLEIGDYAAISYGNEIFGPGSMGLDEAYWYGLLFGGGSLTSKFSVKFTNMDSHILDFSKEYLNKIGQKFLIRKTPSKAFNIDVHSKEYRGRLKDLGFGYKKSISKTIPKSIRSLKKEPLAMFIRGLYETDGWIGSEKSEPTICIGLSSKKAIDQLHLILLNFGIIASRRVRKTTHEYSHTLTIYRSSIDSFNKNIGLDPKGVKYKRLQGCLKCKIITNENNFIPNQSKNLKSLFNKISRSRFDTCPINWSTIRSWVDDESWINPTKINLEIILKWMISENLNTNHARKILQSIDGIFFDKISSIIETKTDNYDFVVPKTHSFISQGFVNHNTIVAALLTAKLGKSTIIYVIGKDLLYQIHKLFDSLFDEEIGIIGDGKCEIKRINVATIWSVGKCLGFKSTKTLDDEVSKEKEIAKEKRRDIKKMLLETRVHILDECHLAACETVQEIAVNVKAEHFYGMSASPWRDDGADILIESVLGRKVVDISAKYLIERDYLVRPVIRFLSVPHFRGKASAKYKTVYKDYVTVNKERNEMIMVAATKLVEQGFKTLVLFHTKAHGKRLQEMISENVRCGILSGDDKIDVRKEVCRQLESGEIDCIVASKIFDIGVDLPSLSALVIGGGGKSSVRALQRVGRVIRTYKDKVIAPVIDFADQAPYLYDHSIIRRDILREEFEVSWPEEKQEP